MSRYYRMDITVQEFDVARRDAIKKAAEKEWAFENTDWAGSDMEMSNAANSNLTGGESEEEFANRLAAAIFKTNGGPCKVLITALYLEDGEMYVFDADNPPDEPEPEE